MGNCHVLKREREREREREQKIKAEIGIDMYRETGEQ
jgi:hypothetical protein